MTPAEAKGRYNLSLACHAKAPEAYLSRCRDARRLFRISMIQKKLKNIFLIERGGCEPTEDVIVITAGSLEQTDIK
jgi:hypothetical protein